MLQDPAVPRYSLPLATQLPREYGRYADHNPRQLAPYVGAPPLRACISDPHISTSRHLDAQSLVRSSRVCKAWKKVCENDEIWHRAALEWGHTPDSTLTVEEVIQARMDENGYFSKVKSWKDLCIAQELLDAQFGAGRRGGELQNPMSYSFHAAQSEETPGIWQDLWQMKIMPEEGTIVSTGIVGGVRVSDLRTHELLWSIPPEMTKPSPMLEAENGYLIWDGVVDGANKIVVYRSERLFNDLSRQPQRGHYKPWKGFVLPQNVTFKAFRYKHPLLACVTSDRRIIFWNTENRALQETCRIPSSISLEDIKCMDFDSEYAFMGSMRPELHVVQRRTGRLVWTLGYGQPNHKSPLFFDLSFDQDMDRDVESRSKSVHGRDSKAGAVYRPTLRPQGQLEDWLLFCFQDQHYFDLPNMAPGQFPGWQAVHACEETDTLVFCCKGIICLLKGYKCFLQDPSKDPEWFAAYRTPDEEPLRSEQPGGIHHLLECESDWVLSAGEFETCEAETSLSAQNGPALWVSALPLLLDWKSAKCAEDVKVQLVWQDHEAQSAKTIDLSKLESASKYEQFLAQQYPRAAYKFTLRGSSAAVLTETAAYIVETQARRTRSRKADDTSRGVYGPKHQQSVALRTVRCFDWGRNALLRLDKSRCYAEIEAFTELPSHLTSQTTSDYQYSQWTRHLFKRVMSLEGTEGHPNEEDVDPLWM